MKKHTPVKVTNHDETRSLDPIQVRLATQQISDGGKVILGSRSPSLPPVRLAPRQIADSKKVILGSKSPSLLPRREGH